MGNRASRISLFLAAVMLTGIAARTVADAPDPFAGESAALAVQRDLSIYGLRMTSNSVAQIPAPEGKTVWIRGLESVSGGRPQLPDGKKPVAAVIVEQDGVLQGIEVLWARLGPGGLGLAGLEIDCVTAARPDKSLKLIMRPHGLDGGKPSAEFVGTDRTTGEEYFHAIATPNETGDFDIVNLSGTGLPDGMWDCIKACLKNGLRIGFWGLLAFVCCLAIAGLVALLTGGAAAPAVAVILKACIVSLGVAVLTDIIFIATCITLCT